MSRRRTLGTLGAAAVAAGAVLAAPTLGTQANWYDNKTTSAPAMRMGTMSVTVQDHPVVGPATLSATLTNNSGFGVEFGPTSLTFGPRSGTPSATDTQAAKFTNYNSGVEYDYVNCAAVGTARWRIPVTPSTTATKTYTIAPPAPPRDPLARGSASDLCLTVRPSVSDHDRYMQFAGREFTAVTQVQAVSVASTWTAAAQWSSRYVVNLPAPSDPAEWRPCETGRVVGNVTVVWGWPDPQTDRSATTTPAINRFEVWARPRSAPASAYKLIVKVPGSDRNQNVGVNEMWAGGQFANGDYDFVIRAYPFADSTHYVESELIYRATLSNVGPLHQSGTWACDAVPTVTNPGAGTMHGY